MRYLISVMLMIVGVIHLLPLSGVLGSKQLETLYGLSFSDPNLAILMRHRAILFGLLGLFFFLAAFQPQYQRIAFIAGFISFSHAVYLYHRFTLSYRDVQELLFERGVDVSHETVSTRRFRFGPELAEDLRQRKASRGRTWRLDEMRIVVRGDVHWLWRALNERGEVLDVLLQKRRDTKAAKRFFDRLLDVHGLPKSVVTDGLRSFGTVFREVPELAATEYVTVSASEHQNNVIEQSHRPTRV